MDNLTIQTTLSTNLTSLTSTDAGCLLDKGKLNQSIDLDVGEMINLNNLVDLNHMENKNMNSEQFDLPVTISDRLSTSISPLAPGLLTTNSLENEQSSVAMQSGINQWPSLSNPDSWFYFDKYMLRGTGDEHSESMLQDVVQSYENQNSEFNESSTSVVNLITSNHSDSLFKVKEENGDAIDEDDHKPNSMELNYYSSQYLNNPNLFQHHHHHHHHHLNGFTNNSQFFNSTSANRLYDYPSHHSHVHHAMLNGHNITSSSNSNTSNCFTNTKVTYSNSHLAQFDKLSSESEPQQSSQQYFSSSQPQIQNQSAFNTVVDLPGCDHNSFQNSFNFNSTNQHPFQPQQQITHHLTQPHHQQHSIQPHHPMSILFDTDNAYKKQIVQTGKTQVRDDEIFNCNNNMMTDDVIEQRNGLREELDVKEEKLEAFCMRNSLDLINSGDFLDLSAGEQIIQSHQSQNSHNLQIQQQQLQNQELELGLDQESDHQHSTKRNMNNHLKLNGSNDDKKLITIKEAMNMKLEKIKIERANGMKIYYFKCSLCTYQTNTSQSMKDHLFCIHCKAKNNYKCNICHQTFGWKNNAQRHMRRKHKIEDQAIKRNAIVNLI